MVGGRLYFEVGIGQADTVLRMMRAEGFGDINIVPDDQKIPRVVYGAADAKAGSCGSVCDLFSMEYNHHPQVESGIRQEECAQLLREFFAQLRVTLRSRPKWRPPEN